MWNLNNKVGTMSKTLKGPGTFEIKFRNCYTTSNSWVSVYLDDVLISESPKNNKNFTTKTFTYTDG